MEKGVRKAPRRAAQQRVAMIAALRVVARKVPVAPIRVGPMAVRLTAGIQAIGRGVVTVRVRRLTPVEQKPNSQVQVV